MDYFNALVSVNKISILFFAITLVFIFYEFYLFQKERRRSKNIPVKVPEIKDSPTITVKIPPLKASDEKPKASKKPKTMLFIGGILITVFLLLFIASYFFISQRPPQETTPTVVRENTPTPTSITLSPSPTEVIAELPTEAPSPTEVFLAEEESTTEAEVTPQEEEIVVATETPSPTEVVETEQELPVAGNVNFASIIFASALVFFFVAFIL